MRKVFVTGTGAVLDDRPLNEMALEAAKLALQEAKVRGSECALIFGTNFGSDATTDFLKRELEIGGECATLSLSCASGTAVIAEGANMIADGVCDRVLVVAGDEKTRLAWAGLASLRTISPHGLPKPFDLERSGTFFNPAAAAMVLDSAAGNIELSGWATNNNGFHLTAPPPRAAGSAAVMRAACRGKIPDAINAHATGTKANDLTEAQALYDIFGDAAEKIPVCANKALVGHLLGAAGLYEAIVSVKILREQNFPATPAPKPDPAIPPLNIISQARKMEVRSILSNSAGFGGCNAAVFFEIATPNPPAPRKTYKVAQKGYARVADDALDVRSRLPSPKAYLDRQAELALVAAKEAIADFALPENCGVAIGSEEGAWMTAELFEKDLIEKGERFVRPMLFPHTYWNAAASLISMEWKLRGEHENWIGRGAAERAMEAARRAIENGRAEAMLVGNAESSAAEFRLLVREND